MKRQLRFYKPQDKGSGAAFQFSFGRHRTSQDPVMMIEACPQTGPKPAPGSSDSPFNWKDNKITLMVNVNECGELAAYVVNLQKGDKIVENGLSLFHSMEREGQKSQAKFSLTMPKGPAAKYGNWGVQLSRDGENVRMFLSPGEVYQVKVLCDTIIAAYASEEVKYVSRRD